MLKENSPIALSILLCYLLLLAATQTARGADSSPTHFYLTYHQKCLAVSSPKALLPWRSKESIARDQPMSDQEIDSVYPMVKDMMSKNITVISEEINGDKATLKVTGEVPDAAPTSSTKAKKEQAVGVVLLVKEGGQWKMDHESWTSR